MGNQEVRSAMSKIQSKDFNVAELEPFEQKLWTASEFTELADFKKLMNLENIKWETMHVASSALDIA